MLMEFADSRRGEGLLVAEVLVAGCWWRIAASGGVGGDAGRDVGDGSLVAEVLVKSPWW